MLSSVPAALASRTCSPQRCPGQSLFDLRNFLHKLFPCTQLWARANNSPTTPWPVTRVKSQVTPRGRSPHLTARPWHGCLSAAALATRCAAAPLLAPEAPPVGARPQALARRPSAAKRIPMQGACLSCVQALCHQSCARQAAAVSAAFKTCTSAFLPYKPCL